MYGVTSVKKSSSWARFNSSVSGRSRRYASSSVILWTQALFLFPLEAYYGVLKLQFPQELREQSTTLLFNIAMKTVSILRYVADHLSSHPLSVTTRLLNTHNLPCLLVTLLEESPWRRTGEKGVWCVGGRCSACHRAYGSLSWSALWYWSLHCVSSICYICTYTYTPHLMDPLRSRQPLYSGQAACYGFSYLH